MRAQLTAVRKKRGKRNSSAGAQLVELALSVPILLVLVIGIWDLGAAFARKQKLTNAARVADRIVVSAPTKNPLNPVGCSPAVPCSVVAAATAAQQYLTNASLDASWINPSSPTNNPVEGVCEWKWTYSPSNTTTSNYYELDITSGVWLTPSGDVLPVTATNRPTGTVAATQVTLKYPVAWNWAASFTAPFSKELSTTVTMVNIGGGC